MNIAHENQTLKVHILGVARLSRKNAGKIGCGGLWRTARALHIFGKYGKNFQDYIKSATGMLDPDTDEEFVEVAELRGKIDHSTAGAQFVWTRFSAGVPAEQLLAQILSLCLVSHHSGIIDCLTTDSRGTYDAFTRRITKSDEKTHFQEVVSKARRKLRNGSICLYQSPILRNRWKPYSRVSLRQFQKRINNQPYFSFRWGFLFAFFSAV